MEYSSVPAFRAATRYSLAVGFTGAVVIASLLPAPAAVAAPGPLRLVGVDKWIHVGSYAAIAFLFAFAYYARSVLVLIAIAAVSVLVGVGVELLQSTITWRTMELADVVANTAGTVVALFVWWYAGTSLMTTTEVERPRSTNG